SFQNKKIFYRVEGGGKTVILIHGFAEDGSIWNYQADKLKKKFRLIIPDLPGSGKSELLEGEISISDYADAVKAIVDAEIKTAGNTFTILGHSMGGYISLAFAEKYAELLNGLGLFHSSCFADDDLKKEARNRGIVFIQKNGPEAFLKNTIPNLFSQKTKQEAPALVEKLIELSRNFTSKALIQYYEAMMKRPDSSQILRSFAKPVLFIQGLHDTAVPLQAGLEQSHIPSISYFKILKKSGHMGMWEEENSATRYIDEFIRQV
ncbi:MAG: alpha/beta hydrolase, partial [Chitinophagaceae bacterium]